MRTLAQTTRTTENALVNLSARGHSGKVSEHKNAPPVSSFSALMIYRKASCACGGGCPACQAKSSDLRVSQPNDPAEIEADQITDKVMRMPADAPVTLNNHHSHELDKLPAKCSECEESEEEETVLRKEGNIATDPPLADDGTSSVRIVTNPGGPPLGSQTRTFMEPRFGYDHSRIAARRLAGGVIQAKLTINETGDIYEQEADRVADQVLAAPAHSAVSGAPPRIQPFSGQSIGRMNSAPDSVDRIIASPGSPLEPALRLDMEQRFGHDFSQVLVHTDAAAEQSAQDVNANAYTVGQEIVFGTSRFSPGSSAGRRLIAHELTHVVQQSDADRHSFGESTERGGQSLNFFTAQQMKSTMGTLLRSTGSVVMADSRDGGVQPSTLPTIDDLTMAVSNHDLGMVQQIISSGVDVNGLDKNGMTPLTQATKDGNLQIMELLINNGAKVDRVNHDRKTALILAAASGNQQAADLLLRNNAWVNAQDLEHMGPLFLSVQNGDLKMVNFFLQNGADVDLTADGGRTSLMEAASKGNQVIMKALIQNGAKVNREDTNNRTALMEAASAGDPKSVKLLLAEHADPNMVDNFGQTALMEASRSGNAEATKELLKAQADVNVQDQNNRTALMDAARKGKHDIVKALVQNRKTDVNLKDNKGTTALLEAARSGDLATVKAILQSKHKVDLNVQDNDHKTALMEAASSGTPGMVKALVQMTPKPDLNVPDSDGKTALILAVDRANVEGVKVLVQSGAKLNITDNGGDTALSAAEQLLHGAISPDTQKAFGEIVPFLQKAQQNPKSKP